MMNANLCGYLDIIENLKENLLIGELNFDLSHLTCTIREILIILTVDKIFFPIILNYNAIMFISMRLKTFVHYIRGSWGEREVRRKVVEYGRGDEWSTVLKKVLSTLH
jgi:hypothetical protein